MLYIQFSFKLHKKLLGKVALKILSNQFNTNPEKLTQTNKYIRFRVL